MPDRPLPPDRFESTHWSLVLRAGREADTAAHVALEWLCRRYWFPLYAYVRHRTPDVHEAQDLTQEFFARVLEKDVLASASPDRGKFRSFLLTAMKNFLANQWDRTQAARRGGGREKLALDWAQGESRYNLEPHHELTPERVFDRQWALSLLDVVIDRLQQEFVADGKSPHFEILKAALTGERGAIDYSRAAAELGMSEDAVRQAASRLRKRYRELLRDEVAQTVTDPAEIDDELRGLFEALGA